MLGIEILDVAIGLVFVFLLVSIMVTAVREAIEHFCKARAAHLEVAIREMLWDKGGSGVAKAIYEHPLIFSLFRGGYKPITSAQPGAFTKSGDLPSYIPSRSFASAWSRTAAQATRRCCRFSAATTSNGKVPQAARRPMGRSEPAELEGTGSIVWLVRQLSVVRRPLRLGIGATDH